MCAKGRLHRSHAPVKEAFSAVCGGGSMRRAHRASAVLNRRNAARGVSAHASDDPLRKKRRTQARLFSGSQRIACTAASFRIAREHAMLDKRKNVAVRGILRALGEQGVL
jgi:hypothetical protein